MKKSKPNPSSDATNQEPVPLRKCLTFIEAKIDVGFGNTLFIRGDGAGLNWSTGVPLECIDASTWIWSSREPAEKIAFRLLINDDIWATSVMFFAPAGERTQVVPVFHHA